MQQAHEPYAAMLGALTHAMEDGLGFNRGKSLRWIARTLDVDAGSLSRILSGKRRLQPTQALYIANRLSLAPEQKEQLVELVMAVALEELIDSVRSLGGDDQKIAPEHIAESILKAAQSVQSRVKKP